MALEERIVKKHLYEWLLDHNTLTIPQLGRFEATPTSATIQPGVYKFLPPNKKVTFHTEHEPTDVQLRDILVERENLTGEQANYTVNVFVQKVKESLSIRQRYELEGFGLLSQVNEHSIIFRIDEEANVEGDSYGLPGLYPKPLVHTAENSLNTISSPLTKTNPDLPPYEQEVEDAYTPLTTPHFNSKTNTTTTSKDTEVDEITIEEKRLNRSSNTLLIGFFTIIFAFLVVVLAYLITDSDVSEAENKNVPPKKEDKPKVEDKKVEEPVKEEKKEPKKEDDKSTTPVSTQPNITYTTNGNYVSRFAWLPQVPTNLDNILNKTPQKKSYVVLGSFDKAENAYSFYNNLLKRGITTACIIAPVEGNPRYRACLGKYNTVEDAMKAGLSFGKINAVGFFILTY